MLSREKYQDWLFVLGALVILDMEVRFGAEICLDHGRSRLAQFLKNGRTGSVIAEARGLVFSCDGEYVLEKEAGTAGRENEPAVILQAHMDMVWNKEDGYDFDFETMPIKCVVEGDILKSYRTTLGADDGIGVALFMA